LEKELAIGSKELARAISSLALSKKAEQLRILDLRGLTDITDFFVICSGSSDLHIKAIADAIVEGAKKLGVKVWHIEGYQALSWVLLDYITVVVHIFRPEAREKYALEKLWGDAPVEEIEDEGKDLSKREAEGRH